MIFFFCVCVYVYVCMLITTEEKELCRARARVVVHSKHFRKSDKVFVVSVEITKDVSGRLNLDTRTIPLEELLHISSDALQVVSVDKVVVVVLVLLPRIGAACLVLHKVVSQEVEHVAGTPFCIAVVTVAEYLTRHGLPQAFFGYD